MCVRVRIYQRYSEETAARSVKNFQGKVVKYEVLHLDARFFLFFINFYLTFHEMFRIFLMF